MQVIVTSTKPVVRPLGKKLNILAESPLKGLIGVGAADFKDVVGATADITTFADRWAWIDHAGPPAGMWQDWTSLPQGGRTVIVNMSLRDRAEPFSKFFWWDSTAYPIIW